MIAVSRPDLIHGDWVAWRDKSKAAMSDLVGHYHVGEEVVLKDALYKEAMPYLLEVTHGKCAYCETMISANQPGDVEHYRPKGRIRDKDGQIVKVRVDNADVEHPGYWWLAYSWHNLLPACIDCNRRRRHTISGTMAGKADCFEVRGHRALLPGDDLSREDPLLIDPAAPGFDPGKHFEFLADGSIKPLTDEARYSCELLGLNLREKLVEMRSLAYLHAMEAMAAYLNAISAIVYLLNQAPISTPSALAAVRRQVNDMWEGRGEYSAFARQGLEAVRSMASTRGVQIQLPLI